MAHRKTSKRSKARTMLRLADFEQSKNAVLRWLGAPSSQESYGHAIDEFIGWYCSEPRLSFNRTVVLRSRLFLEQKLFKARLLLCRRTLEPESVSPSVSSADRKLARNGFGEISSKLTSGPE